MKFFKRKGAKNGAKYANGLSMKTKKHRRLEIDTSPPSEARGKVEAEILAFRAFESLKPWMQAQIKHAVNEELRARGAIRSAK